MVVVHPTVDIVELKARHPLGDAVEAAGVALRGKGRVRQGVCPFHQEAEGSFTVYGDSEKFYCFGCGAGGDVLDFVQRTEGLTLPEAIRRLDGGSTPLTASPVRPTAARQPAPPALPLRDPALLTAAVRFYAGELRRSPKARAYLASREIGAGAAMELGLGYAPGRGLSEHLQLTGFGGKRLRDSGLFLERGAERFAGMILVPDLAHGLVRWLTGRAIGAGATPRFQAVPGPKPVLGLARLGPAPEFVILTEGVFDWLTLAAWGYPACRPGHPGHRQGGGGAAGLSQGVPGLRQRRSRPGGNGQPASPAGPPRRRGQLALQHRRRGRVGDAAQWTAHLPPIAGKGRPRCQVVQSLSPNLLSTGPPSPAGPSFFTHSPTDPLGLPLPISCRGPSPRLRLPVSEAARTSITHGITTSRRYVMSNENGNGNQRNGANNNGHQRNGQVNGSVNGNHNGNGHHAAESIPAHDLLWDSLSASVTEKLAQPLDASLVSQRRGRGNRSFSYVEGRTAIDQANRIFGHGGWGHEVVGDVMLRELDQANTQTGEVKRIRAYSATVKVTVPGAPSRTDVGFQPVSDETAEGHETAFKGAVTDALKRALRTFGPQFGNSLYGDLANQPAGGAGDTLAPALRKTLLDLGVSQGFDEERVRQAVRGQTGRDLDDLPASELTPLVERAARKVQQRQEAETQTGAAEQ